MFEKEILKLLQKITIQLEMISFVQKEIKGEISLIYKELSDFQEKTLKQLSQPVPTSPVDSLLN